MAWRALILPVGLMAVFIPLWAGPWPGPLARHMAAHIAMMNLLAPVVALLWNDGARSDRRLGLACPTVLQLVLIYAWHTPPMLAAAHGGGPISLAAGASLFVAALWFWRAVLSQAGQARWRAILALLVTGKLFCLLGVLLVFAPRALYPAMSGYGGAGGMSPLEDQQLAGLMMLAACPLTYVLAGVVAAARWLDELAARDAADGTIR